MKNSSLSGCAIFIGLGVKMKINIPVENEKIFKKYMKPQILIEEYYLKLGLKCWVPMTIFVWIVKLIGVGQWSSIEDVFTQFFVSAFISIWITLFPCGLIGGFKRYFAFRNQVLEDDESPPHAQITPKKEINKKNSIPRIKIQRSIESLAVELSLLQQQVAQIERSLWDKRKNEP